jgi:hypothetical protein
VSIGEIQRIRGTRGDGRRHRGHVSGGSGPSRDRLAVTPGKAAWLVPEVAPGGDGTRFCGECRFAAAGRGSAVPVRRSARPVGSCMPACRGDAGGWEEWWPRRSRCRGAGGRLSFFLLICGRGGGMARRWSWRCWCWRRRPRRRAARQPGRAVVPLDGVGAGAGRVEPGAAAGGLLAGRDEPFDSST